MWYCRFSIKKYYDILNESSHGSSVAEQENERTEKEIRVNKSIYSFHLPISSSAKKLKGYEQNEGILTVQVNGM